MSERRNEEVVAVVGYSFRRESGDASCVAGQRGSRDVWNLLWGRAVCGIWPCARSGELGMW